MSAIYIYVNAWHTKRRRVRCRGCGAEYGKPFGPGTRLANPGCPVCDYVGWEPMGGATAFELPRLSSDRRLLRSA